MQTWYSNTRPKDVGGTTWRSMCLFAVVFLAAAGDAVAQDEGSRFDWPEVTTTARPWTRWWWHGSAVELDEISRLLREYHDAGLGGVEITCIYGVQGNEDRNRIYLSDAWIEAVSHAATEARKLEMGVDLPAGSGWRMGGPMVTPEQANSRHVLEKDSVEGGENFTKRIRRTTLQAATAYQPVRRPVDLTDHIRDDRLEWTAPPGEWTVYTLGYRWAGDRVKRAGPGGEGLNINPYSESSVMSFLDAFGEKLDQLPAGGIRAQFHDSFEYEGDWQPEFLDEFAVRRGYRLEEHLRELAGDGDRDQVARVKCDVRETLSDLVLENLILPWVHWAHDHDQLARNQSHGSPANWLDLYAACDIPETESFGRLSGPDAHLYMFKFASSAANIAGHPLVSSETATWLDEHFNVTLAQVKEIVDRLMLAGVNHVFYHGTAYSPSDAAWPGWLFYASTQLNPQNPIWRDFPALNAYVTRSQSVLQASQPDNDVLLYWPIHDAWHDARGFRKEIKVHNGRQWIYGWPLEDAANVLRDAGVAFDFVSDRLLNDCDVQRDGRISAPGGNYQAVVIPKAEHVPARTLEKLAQLARAGANVIFWGQLPESMPGIASVDETARWHELRRGLVALSQDQPDAPPKVRVGADLLELLKAANVRSEPWAAEYELSFLRKQWDGDTVYLVHNPGEQSFEGWITPAAAGNYATLLDAMTGRVGQANLQSDDRLGRIKLRLQLSPGQSLFVRLSEKPAEGVPPWLYQRPVGEPLAVNGPWTVRSITGGPDLPAEFVTDQPRPWTESEDPAAAAFAGTAGYSTSLKMPDANGRWLLDLGEVLGSARVTINGTHVGTLIAPPYQLDIGPLDAGNNRLEIEVTGVAANRIRDLDRRQVPWRIFEDANVVTTNYRPFDASRWPVRPLGLVGPVTLTRLGNQAGSTHSP